MSSSWAVVTAFEGDGDVEDEDAVRRGRGRVRLDGRGMVVGVDDVWDNENSWVTAC
jgi:hypothetical protein